MNEEEQECSRDGLIWHPCKYINTEYRCKRLDLPTSTQPKAYKFIRTNNKKEETMSEEEILELHALLVRKEADRLGVTAAIKAEARRECREAIEEKMLDCVGDGATGNYFNLRAAEAIDALEK